MLCVRRAAAYLNVRMFAWQRPAEREFLASYCQYRGIEMIPDADWEFWKALNCFRTAAISHGVYTRALQGKAASTAGLDKWMQFIQFTDLGLEMLGAPTTAKL